MNSRTKFKHLVTLLKTKKQTAKNNFLHLIESTCCTVPKSIFLQKSDPKQKLY